MKTPRPQKGGELRLTDRSVSARLSIKPSKRRIWKNLNVRTP
jgi:hypothetical protein